MDKKALYAQLEALAQKISGELNCDESAARGLISIVIGAGEEKIVDAARTFNVFGGTPTPATPAPTTTDGDS